MTALNPCPATITAPSLPAGGIQAGGTGPQRDQAALDAHPDEITAAARELVAGLGTRPLGQVSPSVYETGRLVTLAPWLTGHAERVRHLLVTQRTGGDWGVHDGYALVPTLSATEALLAESRRRSPGHARDRPAAAADRGLRALREPLRRASGEGMPDLPAIELIVPYLVTAINGHLRAGALPGAAPLAPPSGAAADRVAALGAALRAGATPPEKLLHALEVTGTAAHRAPGVRPAAGTVGASPAATAAWLGVPGTAGLDAAAVRHLEEAARPHGGPVPCGLPITVFERGWVLSWLARAGIRVTVPAVLTESLAGALAPGGVAAGPGLPADADTTSVALYALTLLGRPADPEGLWPFRAGPHFQTWRGEDGASTTVNAHVLDAFRAHAARYPDASPRYAAAIAEVAGWLRAAQRPDGDWTDRWHVSPYYATMSCALALDELGGPAPEVAAAVRFVRESQRDDGGWGAWRSTAEETAYALHVLTLTRAGRRDPGRPRACAAGRDFLLRTAEHAVHPPMWVDKDLYAPSAIIHAAVLGALALTAGLDAAAAGHPPSRIPT
ncbi:hypothetical protein Sru01_08820 [Sphaerisporangium rufum]|uniref:Squalene cyclase C-terminal domain-containing protein n=1 Tax=Sphaerisporangium rufum TaxID=1381558 RepID=A0A919V333_9ACTN|nr:prenyltransferase/squalene oxidase repeat-containing protein [Sphaerisporangium rufum]GII75900.1 hypothetical protein Sru01_08820 [Sphaerisporangium rufum]